VVAGNRELKVIVLLLVSGFAAERPPFLLTQRFPLGAERTLRFR
jgi:hypothetical protein